ncbi:MAG TPA: S1/P1 nuclease [Burkholderiales bacterium]|nr:S1/P1 nuclease [Burkholderiales bacterium]
MTGITILLSSRFLCGLLALSLAQGACAWGPEGHRMVGDIADRFLTAATRARIEKLLEADRKADDQPSGRRTLGEVANWADEIKDTDWGKRRGSRHYDDIPLCGAAEYAKYCRNGRCASAQLARQIEILGNERARPGQRNEALKWVVHIVGDIHQPLHAANRGDRGGNRMQVSFFGERDNPPYGALNLHAVWDVHMVRRLIADRGGESAIASAPVAARDRSAWERGSIADWVDESHRIAGDTVYALLPVAASCSDKIVDVVALDGTYYARAAPVIEIQIRKAGVRLARVLNETLGR